MAKGPVTVNAIVDEATKQSGEIAFIENTVDPATGTVMAKARIANANDGLWPGPFVRAEVVARHRGGGARGAVAAVQLGPQGAYVFVVKDGKAELRQINVGAHAGRQVGDRQRPAGGE